MFMVAGALVGAGWVIYVNLWRAALFVKPSSMKIEADEPPDQMSLPPELETLENWLRQNGFQVLGSHWEKPLFTGFSMSYDYVLPDKHTFATLYVGRDGGTRLYFLTPTENDGFVVTANYRRPARQLKGRYYSGGLEEYSPDRVFKAHLRRIDNEGLKPTGAFTHEARLAAGKRWFESYGASEIRWQNLHGLLWTLGTVTAVILAVIELMR